MGLSIALRIPKIKKSKGPNLLNFDRNHMKLYGTDEKLLKDSGKNISV